MHQTHQSPIDIANTPSTFCGNRGPRQEKVDVFDGDPILPHSLRKGVDERGSKEFYIPSISVERCEFITGIQKPGLVRDPRYPCNKSNFLRKNIIRIICSIVHPTDYVNLSMRTWIRHWSLLLLILLLRCKMFLLPQLTASQYHDLYRRLRSTLDVILNIASTPAPRSGRISINGQDDKDL